MILFTRIPAVALRLPTLSHSHISFLKHTEIQFTPSTKYITEHRRELASGIVLRALSTRARSESIRIERLNVKVPLELPAPLPPPPRCSTAFERLIEGAVVIDLGTNILPDRRN